MACFMKHQSIKQKSLLHPLVEFVLDDEWRPEGWSGLDAGDWTSDDCDAATGATSWEKPKSPVALNCGTTKVSFDPSATMIL